MHLCTNAQSTHEIFAIKKNQPEPQIKCLSVSTEHEVQHFSDHLRCEIRKQALSLYLNRRCLDVSSAYLWLQAVCRLVLITRLKSIRVVFMPNLSW